MGRVLSLTFANQLSGNLGPPTRTDMMRGAANQVNDQPAHGRRTARVGHRRGGRGGGGSRPARLVSRSEDLLGVRPDASVRWPGRPGQQVYIPCKDGKASPGRPRARGGYFAGPACKVAGWHAREIAGGQALVATSNLAFIGNPNVLLSALARSDGLPALHGPLRAEIGAIYAATPSCSATRRRRLGRAPSYANRLSEPPWPSSPRPTRTANICSPVGRHGQ